MVTRLRITKVENATDLRGSFDAWDRLVQYHPLRSPGWLMAWWEHTLTGNEQLFVLLLHDDDELVGIAPLYRTKAGGRVAVRFLGSGKACTDHTTWFARQGKQREVGLAIARYLIDNDSWGRLHLESSSDDEAMQAFQECLQRAGCLLHDSATPSCWAIKLPDSWEGYLEMLSKSHRKRTRRLHREFFESGRICVHTVGTEHEFEAAWNMLIHLHSERWGTTDRPRGIFTDPRQARFHEAAARELLRRDQLRLCWLECDGRPVAAEYQFFDSDTIFGYQAGMAPDAGKIQPGNLSMMATIKFGIEHDIRHVDLLRGDEPYKAHWRATASPRHNLRIWRGRLIDRCEFGLHGVKQMTTF